jgi:rhodanese-related sulfurtransferase
MIMNELFNRMDMHSQGVLSVTPRETNELVKEGAILVDLRDTDYIDYKAFDVDHVIILPMSVFEEQVKNLDPEGHYILADSSGIKSHIYVEKMMKLGYTHVASLSGGFVEWERDGLPVRVDVHERLTGACACQLKPRERKRE